MRQEKLASLGQLAAGDEHSGRLLPEAGRRDAIAGAKIITAGGKSLELEYILGDGGSLIAESLEGVQRVTKIVRDLKSFS